MADKVTHSGSCHCGAVTFAVRAPRRITVQHCNCSMCSRLGYEHLIVPAGDFELRSGEEVLRTYTFNTGVARHRFCGVCGVKSFYVPRSNPDGYSVNLRCLDQRQLDEVLHEDFDGRNWETGGAALAALTQPAEAAR